MSYEPTTWKTGDVITANKLNKIEQGIAAIGDTPVVTDHPIIVVNATMNGTTVTLGKTWQEIHDAFEAGKLVFISYMAPSGEEEDSTLWYVVDTYLDEDTCYVGAKTGSTSIAIWFKASSANGYPSRNTGGEGGEGDGGIK